MAETIPTGAASNRMIGFAGNGGDVGQQKVKSTADLREAKKNAQGLSAFD